MNLPIPEQLSTERLLLSRLKYEEAEEIFYTYASKPEATKFMSWPTHRNLDDTRTFLKFSIPGWQAGTDYSFGIRLRKNNRFIGSCGMLHNEGKIQFGYILSPTQWGRGYATEVCNAMLNMIRKMPDVYYISTFVDMENTASANVLRKCGLVEEARSEKYFKFVNQGNQDKDCFLFKLPL